MSDYRVDGAVVVAQDADAAAARWIRLTGAEQVAVTVEPALGARRLTLRVGNGFVDVLEADGAGWTADLLAARGSHLVATSIANPLGVEAVSPRAREHARELADGAVLLTPDGLGGIGTHLLLRRADQREPVGSLGTWYESTLLVHDVTDAAERLADALRLDRTLFRRIESVSFGYDGILTMFRRGELSRLEVVRPWERDTTMRRFYERHGEALHLVFAECAGLETVGDKITADGYKYEHIYRKNMVQQIFVPPAALSGVMLGLAYPDEAWDWSRGELLDAAEDAG